MGYIRVNGEKFRFAGILANADVGKGYIELHLFKSESNQKIEFITILKNKKESIPQTFATFYTDLFTRGEIIRKPLKEANVIYTDDI